MAVMGQARLNSAITSEWRSRAWAAAIVSSVPRYTIDMYFDKVMGSEGTRTSWRWRRLAGSPQHPDPLCAPPAPAAAADTNRAHIN